MDEQTEMAVDGEAITRLDTGVAHIARVYDYLLGGKDNFASDRVAAGELVKVLPSIVPAVRGCRAFLIRVVRYLAAEAGIRQFLDIGTGLPTANNTHETAQQAAPDSRVVYVDNDPLVLVHARALLTSSPEGKTAYLDADLRDPGKILKEAAEALDFSRPVAVMLVGVLHCIPDDGDPWAIVNQIMAAVPPGSYLVVGAPASDVQAEAEKGAAGLNARLAEPVTFRSRGQIARFLDGLEILEPGVVQYPHWRPDPGAEPVPDTPAWCAVARKN
ncbi:SAM-dependent methyltransferase [Micromonospora sp. NPDC047730]|uniref:SAM-dependent methyltransferase n=1 Tax=Micromonospora sp. NPDC047730 TaxID=3364253 RepID=UPI003713D04D